MDRLVVRFGGRRRGSILIFALGVLAILSIMSIGYVTVVRIDRGSAAAVNRQANFQQQVDAVVGHLKNLLTADLFGNKIVDRTTPRESWPRAFEDGESWDYPTIDEPDVRLNGYTFNTNDAGDQSSPNAQIRFEPDSFMDRAPNGYFPAARPDDAWLASTEPAWESAVPSNGDPTWWAQITNLRSGWRYNTNRNSPRVRNHYWERGDGRFADLGRFFSEPRNVDGGRFGNAGVDLLARVFPQGSVNGYGAERGTSLLGSRETMVYQQQMANLSGETDEFESSDERFWVDTDGDRRPDARWTQLDSLGNLYGLVWVTAARIIDASALVNVNTAIDFINNDVSNPDPENYGDGMTPSDVDLFRLLRQYQIDINVGQYFDPVQMDRVRWAYNERLQEGLGFGSNFVSDLRGGGVVPINNDRSARMLGLPLFDVVNDLTNYNPFDVDPGGNYVPLTARQRQAFYELGALALENPISPYADHYEVRDLRDLMAYWGTNEERMLSKLEQHIDGPLSSGYFPGANGNPNIWGPMRSRETAADARKWHSDINQMKPELQQMKFSVRRLLTTVSGVGAASPVAVLNEHVGDKTIREKINLRELSSARRTRDVPRMFEALVWALAPFATDMPVMSDTTINVSNRRHGKPLPDADVIDAADMSSLCYGGLSGGAPESPVAAEELRVGVADSAAAYSVITAASLAANIQDAGDADDTPTVIRLFNNVDAEDDRSTIKIVEMGTRLAQGDIPPAMLPAGYAGTVADGLTIVGLERQPFITEVVTTAWYSNAIEDLAGATDTREIDGANPDNQLGSLVVIELYNPWSEAITLDDSWRFVIPESPNILGGANDLRFVLGGTTIDAGQAKRFMAVHETGNYGTSWAGASLVAEAGTEYPAPNTVTMTPDFTVGDPVMFQAITVATDPPRPALLLRRVDIDGAGTIEEYVVDRVVPQSFGITAFPAGLVSIFNIASPPVGETYRNIGGLGNLDAASYFQTFLNYPSAVAVTTDPRFTQVSGDIVGRVAVTSTLTRPSENTALDGGMPAAMLAFNGRTPGDPDSRNSYGVVKDVNAWMTPPADGVGETVEALATRGNPLSIFLDDISSPVGVNQRLLYTTLQPSSLDDGIGGIVKNADANVVSNELPGFQFKTPRGTGSTDDGFIALSELHQVSVYSHTCLDHDLLNLDKWETVGEKLARSRDYYFIDTATPAAPADPNPYMGVLDPMRYIPGDDIATGVLNLDQLLPDSMRVPLALRVFDVFDAMPRRDSGRGRGDLQMGRVNINTAPAEVLMVLPFVAPYTPINDGVPVLIGEGGLGQHAENMERVAAIMAYRGDTSSLGAPFNTSFDEPREITGLTRIASGQSKLRDVSGLVGAFTKQRSYGFASIGELATLHQFDVTTGNVPVPKAPSTALVPGGAAFDGFMSLGADAFHSPGGGNAIGILHPLDLTPNAIIEYNPMDDPEERLAMFRALSNIVTQRSDVYLAWFVLRGYSPDVIEQIQVDGSGSLAVEKAMNKPEFRAAYETRWLAVLDRSNVRTPLDRPEVLMLVELPSTSP